MSSRWWWQPAAGPWQVPLGCLWFSALAVGIWLGPWPLAFIIGAVCAVAAHQTAVSWNNAGERADAALAALIAGLAGPAAAVHTAAVGALLVAGAVVALLGASVQRTHTSIPMRDAGFTVQSWLLPALLAASVVRAHVYEPGAVIWLIALAGIYDAGSYLIGAGSTQYWEGPVAGAVGVAVMSFALVTIGVPPLDEAAGLRFGAAALVLLPAGVIAASLVLPHADDRAPGLRRIDSLLLLAPIWAWAIGRYIESVVP